LRRVNNLRLSIIKLGLSDQKLLHFDVNLADGLTFRNLHTLALLQQMLVLVRLGLEHNFQVPSDFERRLFEAAIESKLEPPADPELIIIGVEGDAAGPELAILVPLGQLNREREAVLTSDDLVVFEHELLLHYRVTPHLLMLLPAELINAAHFLIKHKVVNITDISQVFLFFLILFLVQIRLFWRFRCVFICLSKLEFLNRQL
jgi:hypothetical protein